VPKGLFGYTDRDVPRHDYNPAKAKELLAEAGYPNGFEMNYDTSQSPSHLPLATAISDQLRKVNITAKLVVTDVATWWGKVTKRNTDFTMNLMSYLADPHFTLKRYFHSSSGLNVSRYEKIDALLDKSGGEMNGKKRLELYQQIQKQFMLDLPGIPLMDIHNPIAHKKNISGVPEREFVLGIDLYPVHFTEKP
jgi:peptide/nickel transport system substrate-binding protein